jgi:hypothetical protein
MSFGNNTAVIAKLSEGRDSLYPGPKCSVTLIFFIKMKLQTSKQIKINIFNIFNRGCFASNGSSTFVLICVMQISVIAPSHLQCLLDKSVANARKFMSTYSEIKSSLQSHKQHPTVQRISF